MAVFEDGPAGDKDIANGGAACGEDDVSEQGIGAGASDGKIVEGDGEKVGGESFLQAARRGSEAGGAGLGGAGEEAFRQALGIFAGGEHGALQAFEAEVILQLARVFQ